MTNSHSKRKHSYVSPALAILTGLSLCALLAPFIFAYGFIYPQGDDFDSASRAVCLFDFIGGIYEVFREWFTWSGRYTYHFMAVFFGKAAESRFWSGLVCFGVLCSYAFAFWWLISPLVSHRFYSRIHAAVLSIGALLALYASFGSLPNFYLLTDALTIAHQGATALFFLALVTALWQKVFVSKEDCKKEWRHTLLTGIFAVGVYEHAALAVICISLTFFAFACVMRKRTPHLTLLEKIHFQHSHASGKWNRRFDKLLGRLNTPIIRPFLTLTLCLLLPLAFSFLAPGNFVRNMKRGVDAALQIEQIGMVWTDWLGAMGAFLQSPWIPLLTCLVFAMRFFTHPEKRANSYMSMIAAIASVICFLAFSFSLVFLHALTDVPFHAQKKLLASFGFYAAITFAVLLFNALAHLQLPARLPRVARSLLALLCMGVFAWLVLNTHNFRAVCLNAVNGGMGVLALEMEARDKWLADLRKENEIQLEPTGLIGEILFPGIRERKVRADLPQAVVARIEEPVFPVYMREALQDSCEGWPNLWAAWMYGQGCVMAKKPDPAKALSMARAGVAREVELPDALRTFGFTRAWRVDAQGGKGPTFALSWLVLEGAAEQSMELYVLCCNPPMTARLAPLAMQKKWLQELQKGSPIQLPFIAELAASVLNFRIFPDSSGLRAFPVGQNPDFNSAFPDTLFISLNGKDYHALKNMDGLKGE